MAYNIYFEAAGFAFETFVVAALILYLLGDGSLAEETSSAYSD